MSRMQPATSLGIIDAVYGGSNFQWQEEEGAGREQRWEGQRE